ncbi:unnamed protein product [Sphagnum balticum]
MRRSHDFLTAPGVHVCPNCGALAQPHHLCTSCGYYKARSSDGTSLKRMNDYRSRLTGTGSYLPKKRLWNEDLEKLVDTNDQWIRERTGIRARHLAADGEFTSDLALKASQAAIQAAGLDPKIST